ncbi:MAG TPA: ECF-type sigma factor [Rhodanobacteraceae bacterium]|nr:ECF-type sigma factor [Rhodanobacteraceae bacterium]
MDDDITRLVEAVAAGDAQAYEKLFATVYTELKRVARHQLRGIASPTLDTTGLVHDVYLKLSCPEALTLSSRKHFFALAAKAMRQIVIDHARAQVTNKRSGKAHAVSIDEASSLQAEQMAPDQLLNLDRELSRLGEAHPRLASLIELRFFAGLELEQIAAMQQVSERTLNRDWRRARAELYAALYD